MVQRFPANQLREVGMSIFHYLQGFSNIPGGWPWDFWTINSMSLVGPCFKHLGITMMEASNSKALASCCFRCGGGLFGSQGAKKNGRKVNIWVVVSNLLCLRVTAPTRCVRHDRWFQIWYLIFTPIYLGKWSKLTSIFFLDGLVQPPSRYGWICGVIPKNLGKSWEKDCTYIPVFKDGIGTLHPALIRNGFVVLGNDMYHRVKIYTSCMARETYEWVEIQK